MNWNSLYVILFIVVPPFLGLFSGITYGAQVDEGLIAPPKPMADVMAPAVYADAARKLLVPIDRDALSKNTEPDCGILLTKITPGSQADKLGITAPSIFLDLDGVFVPDRFYFDFFMLRQNVPQTMTVWSAAAGERTVTVAPGTIGFTWEDRPRRLDLTYMHGMPRHPAFDDDMLVACLAGDNVDLKETALARVQAAGGQPTPWFSLASWVASSRGHFEDAIVYGHRAIESEHDRSAKWRYGPIILNAALACDDVVEARKTMMDLGVAPHPTMNPYALVPIIDKALAERSAHPGATPPVSDRTQKSLKEAGDALSDASDRLIPVDGRSQRGIDAMRGNHGILTYNVPRGKRNLLHLGPLGHDVSLSCTIAYDAKTRKPGDQESFVGFGLCRPEEKGEPTLLYQANIDASMDGMTSIYPQGLMMCFIHPAIENGPGVPNHVRVTAVGERMEIELNGIIIYRAHIDNANDRKLGFFFWMQQVPGTCTDISWRIDKASLDVAPKPLPAPAKPKAGADDF